MNKSQISIPCRAVLFDMDGFLVDSTAVIERSWRKWALANNIDQEELMHLIHGRTAPDTIRTIAPHLDTQKEWQILIDQEMNDPQGPEPFDGVDKLLRALPRGRWAIVTSAPRNIAVDRLKRRNLPIPQVLICAQDVTEGKPSPQGYLAAARALGIAPQDCIIIEDALPGIKAAHNANTKAIAIASTVPANKLQEADWVVNKIADIEAVSSDKEIKLKLPGRAQ